MRRWIRCLDTLVAGGGEVYERVWRTTATGRRVGIVLLIAAGLLAGCGQRGPLTLPTRDVEATPAPAPETQVTDEEQESEEQESNDEED